MFQDRILAKDGNTICTLLISQDNDLPVLFNFKTMLICLHLGTALLHLVQLLVAQRSDGSAGLVPHPRLL